MLGFTPRFALLAALSSIAALTVLPAPVRGGLVNAATQDLSPSLAARHSVHGGTIKAAAANANGDRSLDSKHDRKHLKLSGGKGDASSDSSGVHGQHSHKPVAPLPSPLAPNPNKALKKESKKKGEQASTHRLKAKEKHAKQAREVYSIDPVTRMRSLWVGGGITVRDVQLETLPPRLDKRHHRHHHHHHHGSDEVVVKGDDDDVHIHRRFVSSIAPPVQVSDPDLELGKVLIDGTNDHVHIHGHHGDDNHSAVVVKGDNDHIHVRRDPTPHHHNSIVVKGDDQHVHVHREPAAHHHHHHHPEKVVVDGDNDRVHVHRAPSPRRPHHHHHGSEVVVNGDHDGVHIHHRAPRHRHHRHKVIVEGDHQHVHSGRSPVAFPEHRHQHHGPDKVVVKGQHDHIDIHRKRFQDYRYPIVIGGNRAKAYLIPQKELVVDSLVSSPAGTKMHVRRDAQSITGVPGTIEIMSQNSGSKAVRIASLVVATPSNNSTAEGSPFVLNASDTDRTQMYLVPVSSASTNGTSASSNSTSSLPAGPPAPPSADLPVPSPGSTPPTTKSASSFVKVFLQMPIFDAAAAQLEPYCATFDPRPLSPAPMTVEKCHNALSSDFHKSQVFAYEPESGFLHPMSYAGEDDGTSNDDSSPSTPSSAPASPAAAPSPPTGPSGGPPSPPVNSSAPVSNGVPAVTSLEEEALEDEFGDSTHAPILAPEIFAAEALQNARNVTLLFAPTTPEVMPNSGVGKVAELPVASVPVNPPVAKPVPAPGAGAPTGDAAGSATQSAPASSSSDTDTGATTAAAATSATGAGTGTTGAPATDTGSSTTATPSDGGAGDSLAAQDLLAPATPTQTLEVNVYAADTSDTAGGPSSSSSSSGSGSSSAVAASASATSSTNGTDSGSSSTPTMTPESTAPYEWMFQGTNASP
ncbi:hypothetical protein GSI_12704 [Ganoderma sinense ZZ0214-1]|uniref:Transporter n=1 Tax=Ganoderma sinense ZZ0214-1 TaxID=1077348 RepID=A0A2G8RU05_9APHY|nr:hypothetical protein GSI_12704 [Ganoderma sinense ZZ0214-1]